MGRTIASPQPDTANRDIGGIAWRPILAAVLSFPAIVWQKFRTGFWSVRNKLSSDIAKPLDIERIATHLAVVKRADEEGRRNHPPSGEEVPAGTQREIIAYFTNLRRRARQLAADTAEKTSRSLEEIHGSDSLAKLRDIPAGCENKILRYIAEFESRLNNTIEQEQQEKQHYDAFREKNKLDRVANYPGAAYYYYLIVPVLIVALAVALASMVVTDAGGTSGVSVAWIVAVSAVTVIVPFMLGDALLRRMNHLSEFNKFIGRIGAIAAIVTIIGMAFYADFHTAAVLENPNATGRDVFDTMLVAPLDVISGIASLKCFGLVVLTGLFAMLLAYRSDDPYPGYGAVQRTYYKARDARDDIASQLRKRINSLIDEAEADIARIAKGFKTKVRTYTRMVEKAKQNPAALNDYDVELEDACNIVLDRYRLANAAVRQSDSPMSFTEHVCFNPDGEIELGSHSNGSSQITELQAAIAELENEANVARQNLRAMNLRMINSITEPHSAGTESAA